MANALTIGDMVTVRLTGDKGMIVKGRVPYGPPYFGKYPDLDWVVRMPDLREVVFREFELEKQEAA